MDEKEEGLIFMPQTKGRCAQCGGALRKKTITHTQPWGEEIYRFEAVPALVCAKCGEVWLEAAVTQRIDELIRKHPKPRKYQKIPVFSFAEAIRN